MSVFKRQILCCPRCEARGEYNVVASLNVGRHPERRDEILSERFQRFVCAACAKEFAYDGPFSLLDLTGREFILVYPQAWEANWQALEAETVASFKRNMIDLAPSFLGIQQDAYFIRAVFGLAALREKIVCRQAGVDDAALEVLKLDLLRSLPDVPLELSSRPRLRAVKVDGFARETRGGGGSSGLSPMEGAGRAPLNDELELFIPERSLTLHVPRAKLQQMQEAAWAPAVSSLRGAAYVDIGRFFLAGKPAPEPRPIEAA